MLGKSRGILKWMISGNPVKVLKSEDGPPIPQHNTSHFTMGNKNLPSLGAKSFLLSSSYFLFEQPKKRRVQTSLFMGYPFTFCSSTR